MSGTLKDVTDASFEREIERSERPVLVLFWAASDGWADYQAVLGEVVAGYDGKVDGCRINADEHADTAAKCGVRALPTVVLFDRGAWVAQKPGVRSKQQLMAFIDQHL
ncbi:thioredoxin family protein [Nocardia suismassiliense]|uniref:thioredoxin family protein n=1 Tax=Nocardia suismassiliense TaxID=2077092 RepID=UPI00131F0FE1|nr:thioredoxin domain-containing protein [Nocardia suismassiliense]